MSMCNGYVHGGDSSDNSLGPQASTQVRLVAARRLVAALRDLAETKFRPKTCIEGLSMLRITSGGSTDRERVILGRRAKRQMTQYGIALAIIWLSGCASTKDIDLSKVEPACGQTCRTNYNECLSRFTLFPIQMQHECTTALRLCAQSCPAREAQPK